MCCGHGHSGNVYGGNVFSGTKIPACGPSVGLVGQEVAWPPGLGDDVCPLQVDRIACLGHDGDSSLQKNPILTNSKQMTNSQARSNSEEMDMGNLKTCEAKHCRTY